MVARKKSLQDDFRRRYSPRIWGIIARALPYWFAESSHIYSAIVENDSPSPTVTPKALLQFHRFIRSNSTVESQRGQIYQAWAAKSWRGKTVWWRHALYYALLHSPTDASRIAIDISKRPYLQIPGKFIADVLLLIQCRYVDSEVDIKSEDERIIAFYETACQYLEYYVKREGSAILPQSIIRSLSQALDSDRLNRLVKLIDLSKTEYNLYTKLHAMHRYLELNNLTDALELYSTLTEKEFSNRAAKSFCTTVLRLPWQVEDLHTLQQQLTIFMLEKGFHFNTIMRNVILQNHLESGHRQIAWQLLEGFRKAGLNTSEHTYSLFLRHTSPDDYHTISSLYHMAVEDDWLSRSVYLAGYFIQVAASSRLTAGQNSFDAVLKLFRTMFNTTDLEDLGILERSMHTSNLQSPSSFAVQWMLMSWLQENRRDPEKLASVYNNYQFHLKNSHPRISLLASSTHLGTFFVLAFGCNKSHLHMCTRVLQDMIHPTAPASSITHETAPDIPDYEKFLEPEDPIERVTTPTEEQIMIVEQETSLDIPDFEKFLEPEDPIEQEIKHSPEYRQNPDVRSSSPSYIVAPPGEYTWNALLAVLLRHKRLDAAESALTAMRDAGFPPNQYTWNILIEGFATSKIPIEINPAGESQRFKPTANEQNINQLTIFKKESVMLRRFKANLENVKLARDKVYETGHSISQS